MGGKCAFMFITAKPSALIRSRSVMFIMKKEEAPHMQKLDVITVGHFLYDIRDYVKEFPKPDHTALLVRPPSVSPGGSAANVATNMVRLGHSAGLIANVGNDAHGKLILSIMKKNGVDISGVRRMKGRTGLSVILINSSGEVQVIEDIGVMDERRGFDEDYIASARWLHLAGCPFHWLDMASRIAHEKHIPISFDPGRAASRLGEKALAEIFLRTQLLIINRHELKLITGSESVSEAKRLGTDYDMQVVIKGGRKPATVCFPKGCYFIPGFKVDVVDTLGAGDAFDAGVISGRLTRWSLVESVKLGHACAAAKCLHEGAQSMPKRETVLKHFKI